MSQSPYNPWASPGGFNVPNLDPDSRRAMALAEAQRLYQLGEQQCWARRDRMVDWLLAWHGQVTLQHSIQRSQVGHDVTREAIERILPKLLGTNLRFSYYKQGQYAEAASALAAHYLDAMHYFIEKIKQARDKLIYGRGVGKWRWVTDQRTRRRRLRPREVEAFQALGVTDFPRKVDEPVIAYDGPRFHAVDPFSITYDCSVDSPYRCNFLFEEFRETPRSIWNNVQRGLYDEGMARAFVATEQKSYGSVDRWRNLVGARLGLDYSMAHSMGDPTGLGLYEGYFPFDIRGNLRDEPMLIVTDPSFQYPLRLEENPYDHGMAPYSFDDWMSVTGEFWPVGVAEMLEPVQTMVNVWANLAVDNIVLAVFHVWLKHREARIPGNVLRAIPNMMIPTDQMGGLQPLVSEDRTAQIHAWLMYYAKRAQELSGITAFSALGTPELGQTKTALGIQTLKAAAEEFLSFARELMSRESTDYDARFMLELMQQFVDRDLDITLRGLEGAMTPFTVGPEDFDGDFEWRVAVEHRNPLSRELESRAFEEWVGKMLKMGVPINIPAIAIEMAKLQEIAHPERYIMQQAGADKGAMLQQAQAAAMGGQGGGGQAALDFSGGPQPGGDALSLMAGEGNR